MFEEGIEEEINRYETCLVGHFLTEKNINTRAMRSKLVDVWKPTMGDQYQGTGTRYISFLVLP